ADGISQRGRPSAKRKGGPSTLGDTLPTPLFEPHDQYLLRQEKLRQIRQLGCDPYPHRFDSTHTLPELRQQFDAASAEAL
ncbi:MAG: hypothetical protein GWN32_17265, partial [Gemmatimonadetes bacterium]|nr:hypothetical protein [Gemmatimonadota bacterium]